MTPGKYCQLMFVASFLLVATSCRAAFSDIPRDIHQAMAMAPVL